MSQDATISVKNIALEAIDLFFTGWEECGKFVKTGSPKSTNPRARALDTWIILKSITSSGKIHNYRKQLTELLAMCKVKSGSFYSRLKWLKENKLVHIEGKHLHLHSYKVLEQQFGINITEKTQRTIVYDTTDNVSLSEKLFPLALERMKDRSRYMYNKKMKVNTEACINIRNHAIAYNANKEKLDNTEYFRHSHLVLQTKTYQYEAIGETSFSLAHKSCDANPDLNFSQATIGRKTGYTVLEKRDPVTKKDISQSIGVGHLLRRLAAKKLITIKKGHIESEYRARKDEKIFHHRFNPLSKKTIWFRPNQITVNYEHIFSAEETA